jgi:hypothetical protein
MKVARRGSGWGHHIEPAIFLGQKLRQVCRNQLFQDLLNLRFCGPENAVGSSTWKPLVVQDAGDDQRVAIGAKAPFPRLIDPRPKSSDLIERAAIIAKQMRYFGLAAQKLSFSEMLLSAKRAGFTLLNEDTERKEAGFRWAIGEPDFIFFVSFEHPDRVSVVAESYYGDIFGLVLVSHSHVPNISVETKPSLGADELGRNALRLRNVLLMFPDFDDMPAWTKY